MFFQLGAFEVALAVATVLSIVYFVKRRFWRPVRTFGASQTLRIGGFATDCVVHRRTRRSEGEPLTIVVIPGNPGSPAFYHSFAAKVYAGLHEEVDVFVVGHLGHTVGSGNGGRLFSLAEQIAHKEAFVAHLVDANPRVRVVLIGHSVGAYISMGVLKRLHGKLNCIEKTLLLFPALFNHRQSPNGARVSRSPLLHPCVRVVLAAGAHCLGLLPSCVTRLVLRWHVGDYPDMITVMQDLLSYSVVANSLFMGKTEMETIRDLEHHAFVLDRLPHKVLAYYTPNDGWAPLSFANELRERFPVVPVVLDRAGLPHAFVMGGASVMAQLCVQWLQDMKTTVDGAEDTTGNNALDGGT